MKEINKETKNLETNDKRLRFRSKKEYEQRLNQLIGFEERDYLDLY